MNSKKQVDEDLLLVVFVMLFFVLVVLLWSFSLSVVRSCSSVSSVSSVRFVSRRRRVRVSVGVVVRGRSGRRLGGAARLGRLRRVLSRAWSGSRLVVG